VDDTELVVVPAEPIRGLLLENPAILVGLAQQLAADVRRLTGRAADLVFLDLRRRLAKLLIAEAGSDASTINLGLTQSGVAARVGTTRQSLNRAMGELVRRGWIEADGQEVRLLDRDALRRFADS
jgi:CRP-like cAMP-binding protein